MSADLSRRNFLRHAGTGVSAVWVTAHWPAILAASTHAHNAAKSATPPKLEFFTPEQAAEVDAICARIIPSDNTPGAHEAGVVYFIDRALVTFASDDQKTYRDGLPGLQAKVRELFPSVEKFSAATPEQQDQVLRSFDEFAQAGRRGLRGPGGRSFFETVRIHTITGFLVDPDTRGNPEGIGWKLIGHEREHMFKSPFGYYDANYPGWQPDPGAPKTTTANKTSA
jgi:gluconate 2-dehydrogenase gamma chain